MRYIMITHWKGHWEALSERETYYTKNMIRFEVTPDKLVDYTRTIFIKLNEKTKSPEGAWIGYVYGFKDEGNRIRFRYNLERSIPLESLPKSLFSLKEGWYLDLEEWRSGLREVIPFECILFPPFFHLLLRTKDSKEFEDLTFWLLKLIGVHRLYKFEKQAGRPDGFFIFRNLAVIYDCTLNPRFEEEKEQQIMNYCAQLRSGKLEYERDIFDIGDFRKQVWIITRGNSRIIKRVDDIIIREVCVQNLIEIYKDRIIKNFSEEELEEKFLAIQMRT